MTSFISSHNNLQQPQPKRSSVSFDSPARPLSASTRSSFLASAHSPSPSGSDQQPCVIKARLLDPHSPKLLRYFITCYLIVSCVFSLIATTTVQVSLWALLFPLFIFKPNIRLKVMGDVLYFFGGACPFWFSPFWGFIVVKPLPANYYPSDTLVMVNHTSAADPYITARALWPWPLKYIYKSDLQKVPFIGWAAMLSGDIPIYFTKEKGGWGTERGSVAGAMDRVRALHKRGFGTVVFPEGTRSKNGRLQPFRDGFFRYAVEHKCEILPCFIHNAPKVWPLGSRVLDMGNVYFAYGNPTRPLEGETVEQLKTRIRNEMIELQKCCPLFDPECEKPLREDEFTLSRGLGISGRFDSSPEQQ